MAKVAGYRSHKCRKVCALAFALNGIAALSAYAAAPPKCDDIRVLSDIRAAHANLAKAYHFALLRDIQPQETAIAELVPAARNRSVLGGYPWSASRFCQAALTLDAGEADTVYYRIDGLKAGPESQYQLTPCFEAHVQHESAQNGEAFSCAAIRLPLPDAPQRER